MMGRPAVLLTLLSVVSPSAGRRFFSRDAASFAKAYGVCDPEEEVCHGCEQICSQYADDDKVLLSTKCLAECQADCYNCMEGSVPAEELEGQEESCIKEKLLERIKSDGDLVLKIVYDVPPGFKEFDQLYDEDGQIDKRDMEVAFDLLDGGAAPDGTVIPTSKVQVVWEVFREADQDGNGEITEAEFNNYQSAGEDMGEEYEGSHPTPKKKDIVEETTGNVKSTTDGVVDLLEVGKMPPKKAAKANTLAKTAKASPEKKLKHAAVKAKLSYFQHLLRLGLRVWRAEEKQPHPITVLAKRMGEYMIKHPSKGK